MSPFQSAFIQSVPVSTPFSSSFIANVHQSIAPKQISIRPTPSHTASVQSPSPKSPSPVSSQSASSPDRRRFLTGSLKFAAAAFFSQLNTALAPQVPSSLAWAGTASKGSAITDKGKVNELLKSVGAPEVGSVPSGYATLGYKVDGAVFTFNYPWDWVVDEEFDLSIDRPRLEKARFKTKSIVRASDFRKAESVSIYTADTTSSDITKVDIKDITSLVISDIPDIKVIKKEFVDEGPQKYVKIVYKYTVVTEAAYAFERRTVVFATVLNGKLYADSGDMSYKRFNKLEEFLTTAVTSFRVYAA